jgi:hypothetical protein
MMNPDSPEIEATSGKPKAFGDVPYLTFSHIRDFDKAQANTVSLLTMNELLDSLSKVTDNAEILLRFKMEIIPLRQRS